MPAFAFALLVGSLGPAPVLDRMSRGARIGAPPTRQPSCCQRVGMLPAIARSMAMPVPARRRPVRWSLVVGLVLVLAALPAGAATAGGSGHQYCSFPGVTVACRQFRIPSAPCEGLGGAAREGCLQAYDALA